MELNEYQKLASKSDDTQKATIALFGLAGEIGGLFSLFKKRVRDRQPPIQFKDELTEELGDILWYLCALASQHNIELTTIADTNLNKIAQLFNVVRAPFFDSSFPDAERLPNHMDVRFMIDDVTGRSIMQYQGEALGDPLSDNTLSEDDYKFHDVFHLSFLAHLHWSPVLRRLLKCKRKSDPKVDETEDGARAAIVEEAAIALIFSIAEENDFFPDKRSIGAHPILTGQAA